MMESYGVKVKKIFLILLEMAKAKVVGATLALSKISPARMVLSMVFLVFFSLPGCARTEVGQEKNKAAETVSSAQSHVQPPETAETAETEIPPALSLETAETETPPEIPLRIGSLKGPTSMGLLVLEAQADSRYEFQMVTAADELLALMVKKDLDIALVPANLAAVLYQRTDGGVRVIDVNTLGVLYMVSADTQIRSPADLARKTIYLTGKGTVPDYVLRYILEQNGLKATDYDLEYKSEPAEVAALLKADPQSIGLLPQPFVTVACAQNDTLSVVLDMNKEWEKVQPDSSLLTGVTIVRGEVLEQREEQVRLFLEEHEASIQEINRDPEKGAVLVTAAGILGDAALAKEAIPKCNLAYLDGEAMEQALRGYLQVLYDQNPEAVGGKLPEEEFYYKKPS